MQEHLGIKAVRAEELRALLLPFKMKKLSVSLLRIRPHLHLNKAHVDVFG